MYRISLFVEDYGHRAFIVPLLDRLASQYDIVIRTSEYSATGGYGQVQNEFASYVRDLMAFNQDLPDLVVVAQDSNCTGFADRRKVLEQTAEAIKDRVAYAVPDPHIERWMLIDPAAFKAALGKACKTPDQKCDRGRYKRLLAEAVKSAGVAPTLGGMEHAEDIVRHMDLNPTSRGDDFGAFLQEIHARFRLWAQRPDK